MEGAKFIRSIRLENLLSYGPRTPEIELEPLNVLIGPNAEKRDGLSLPGKLGGGYLLEARGLGLHSLSYRKDRCRAEVRPKPGEITISKSLP